MTKLHTLFLDMVEMITNIEDLQSYENSSTSRIEKKKYKLQKEAELIDLEENFRSLKLQLLRDFKQDLKTLSDIDNNDNDNATDND